MLEVVWLEGQQLFLTPRSADQLEDLATLLKLDRELVLSLAVSVGLADMVSRSGRLTPTLLQLVDRLRELSGCGVE